MLNFKEILEAKGFTPSDNELFANTRWVKVSETNDIMFHVFIEGRNGENGVNYFTTTKLKGLPQEADDLAGSFGKGPVEFFEAVLDAGIAILNK